MSQEREKLYMTEETTPSDVLEYATQRLDDPEVLDDHGIVVFNFHNAPLSLPELRQWAVDADSGVYVAPYQISGVWAFMVEALPSAVAQARILAFRPGNEEYIDYPNWRAAWLQADRSLDDASLSMVGRIHDVKMDLEAEGLIEAETAEPIVKVGAFTVRESTADDDVDGRFSFIVEDEGRESQVAFTRRVDATVYARIADADPGGDVDVSG